MCVLTVHNREYSTLLCFTEIGSLLKKKYETPIQKIAQKIIDDK